MFVKTLILCVLLVLCSVVPGAGHGFFLGPPTFLELNDGPPEHDFDGQAGSGIVVNSTEDNFIFSSITGTGGGSFDVDSILTLDSEVIVFNGNVVYYTGG